jgi:hypothetical protein
MGSEIKDALGFEENENNEPKKTEEVTTDTKEKKSEEKTKDSQNENVTLTTEQLEINKEITKIDLELEQIEKNDEPDLDSFYETLEDTLSEDEKALELENKPQYLKLVAQKQKEFESKHSNQDRVKELKEKKEELEAVYERAEAVSRVASKYPEYKHDVMIDFFQKELSQKQQQEIYDASESYEDVYENTFKKYQEAHKKDVKQVESPKIPDMGDVRTQPTKTGAIKDGFKSDDEKLQEALGL